MLKIKVTKENVTKLSEDALYAVLDSLPETHPIYHLVDSEIDRRLYIEKENLKLRQQRQMEQMAQFHKLQSEISEIFEGFKGKKTLLLIEKLGQDFIDDYTICEQTFVVTSLVAHKSYDQNATSQWKFDTIEKARAKKATLIYYRIYDRFMRQPTKENLELLKSLLGE
jgi:hypothetical protein